MRTLVLNVNKDSGFDQPFATLAQQHADALLVGNDPFLLEWRDKIIALAEHYSLPTIYSSRAYVAAGGLMGYGSPGDEAENVAARGIPLSKNGSVS